MKFSILWRGKIDGHVLLTKEVQALFNLARFDLNKDCCWKNYLQTDSDYFSHSICSFINCISIEMTIQLHS